MSEKKYKSIPSTRSDSTSRFSRQLIVQIAREIEKGFPRKEACVKYGMAGSTLDGWMTKFGSEAYHATKISRFSIHQRREIVRAVREQRMTREEVHLIHKVSNKTLSAWLRKAKQDDNDLVSFNHQDMTAKPINYSDPDLQKELEYARLKIKALETMIDIAEQQFSIAIRKKSGAKQ